MTNTTVSRPTPSSVVRTRGTACEPALLARYQALADADSLAWRTRYRKMRLLGSGGQGVVYLAQRQGAHGCCWPLPFKAVSPEPYSDAQAYHDGMACIARVAAPDALA